MKDSMATSWKQSGFSIIELMVALAIFAIVAGFSAPNLQRWMRNYRLKSAVMDLHSNMQVAKLSAVKHNLPWMIRFNSTGTYSIIRCLTNNCAPGGTSTSTTPNGSLGANCNASGADYCVFRTVSFATEYGNEMLYKNPETPTLLFPATPLVFGAAGTTLTPGFAYISNKNNSAYYRVGTEFIAGTIQIQRWTGSGWK
jgi:type IV fimbrial biogenesis protein FimT